MNILSIHLYTYVYNCLYIYVYLHIYIVYITKFSFNLSSMHCAYVYSEFLVDESSIDEILWGYGEALKIFKMLAFLYLN